MATETAYHRIVAALRSHGAKVMERGGEKTESTCPAHDDGNASLSVTGIAGRVLAFCHAGCSTGDVVGALNLTLADLYDERSAAYAYDDGRVVKRYYDGGKKRFAQSGAGPTSTLYHRDRLANVSSTNGAVFLVEGEADVGAIEAVGGVATTAPMGATNFTKADVSPLAGHVVNVVVDRDAAGERWARQVASKLEGVAAKYRFFHAKSGKDASDHIAAGHGLTDFVRYDPDFGTNDSIDYVKAHADGVQMLDVWPDPEPVDDEPLYGDVAALLAGGIPPPPAPVLLRRSDGHALFYAAKVNVLFGDPECGKTWIALAAIVEALALGRKAVFIDLDHNGMNEVVSRLILLGASPAVLADLDRFRYAEPEDALRFLETVADQRRWRPAVAVVDSLGEVLPLLGLSSNSPDDYTDANRRVMTPLATAGAAVIVIDHLPKDDAAREKGQTGTLAKKRTVNGVTLRVTAAEPFAPGKGGAASMTVAKDRPGGVRAHCPVGKNPPAGRFVMTAQPDGSTTWRITEPPQVVRTEVAAEDLAALDGLVPGPTSKRNVQDRLGWGSDRAQRVLSRWRELRKLDE